MKVKFIPVILACSAILASANTISNVSAQTSAVAPVPATSYPVYPQYAVPPQDHFNGLPKILPVKFKISIQVLLS